MPILDVEIVLRPGEKLRQDLARRLALRAGEVFGAPPGTTWVKVSTISAGRYAENDKGGAGPFYPVFVSVLKRKRPPAAGLRKEAAALGDAIADVTGRPRENVHIIYQPGGAGRVAFGGKLVSG